MIGELCMATAASCICHEPAGEHAAHLCCCGGRWSGTYTDDDFEALEFPPALTVMIGPCAHQRARTQT